MDIETTKPSPSIALAVEEAWTLMRHILFEPFDIGKWFVLGFSAWLATLGESGGGSSGGHSAPSKGGGADWEGVTSFVQEYLGIILAIVALVVLILVIVGVVVLWVQSRGKFMFLDNVANNRAEIVRPWKTYRSEGNSLFLWNLVFSIITFFTFMLIAAGAVMTAWGSITSRSFGPDALTSLVIFIPILLLYALVLSIIYALLEDFVVPVMYKQRVGTIAGWRVFLDLLRPRFWHFVLYLLARLGLGIIAAAAIVALVIVTCCIAGCIMAIPYIGTVLLLPVLVYFRAYSLSYLRQHGPAYDVFPSPPDVPEVPAMPTVPQ